MSVFEILGQVLVVLGGLIFLSAALGVLRFPDAYTRISSVGTASGIGIVFVVVGALLVQPSVGNGAKVIAIVILQLATSAIGSMAIARGAYLTRSPMIVKGYQELSDAEESDGLK